MFKFGHLVVNRLMRTGNLDSSSIQLIELLNFLSLGVLIKKRSAFFVTFHCAYYIRWTDSDNRIIMYLFCCFMNRSNQIQIKFYLSSTFHAQNATQGA